MKTITLRTPDFSKKDEFNIKAGAHSLKDAIGQVIVVNAACVGTDTNDKGETVSAGAILSDEGEAYTTISATAIDLIESLIDMLTDDSTPIKVKVDSRKSKNDRDFIVMSIVD